MIAGPNERRATRLFIALSGFFLANALIGEFVGVKIFALETTLGLQPFNWNLFGQTGSLSFTAGVLVWPIVFVMTDVINEYFGVRGVRFISWLAVALIIYAFLAAYAAIHLAPAEWWISVNREHGVPDMQAAFVDYLRPGHVDDCRLGRRLSDRSAHRCRDLPPHPSHHGGALRLAALDRFDRDLAARGQFRGALHRLRARARSTGRPNAFSRSELSTTPTS